MTEGEKLKRAIAHLEAQRDILGEDAVQAASAVLLQRLVALNAPDGDVSQGKQGGAESQFVGRQAEFSVIGRRIEHLTEGHGRFVSIVGEKGIGKSRLVGEVRKYACESSANAPVQWLAGSAGPVGKADSYWLFSRIVRRYADIADHDGEDDAWHKVQSQVAALCGERSTEVLPCLATMMSLRAGDEFLEPVRHLDEEAMRGRILAAVQSLFESMAASQPLVIVMDDLHGIDECSAVLLQHLVPLIYRAPVLMLGISRTTVEAPYAKLREMLTTIYHDRYDEIRLPPLSLPESAKLVANLLRDRSYALVPTDDVLEKARGNPFLIEEAVRSLIHVDYEHPVSYTPKHLADKIVSNRSTIEGERKLVTVMFADVAGFDSLSHELGQEDVRQIMNGCFRMLMDEVHEYEGTVNEFKADGIVALFGAPIASEDHAQRACYAALEIQKALGAFEKNLKIRFGIDFKVRIGLNSGPVDVGAIGDDLRMDFSAQGDTTELAASMRSNAKPGTILVSNRTYRLVKQSFELEPLGKLDVEGKQFPVEAYRLKEKAYKTRGRPDREVYSQMVGRDRELARLELQVLKAVNGEGSVVNVVGDAGIGKSRLLAELKNRDVVTRVRLLEGRAISIGRNLSFHPVIDLLKNWAQIEEKDSPKLALGKLESAVRRVCTDQADEVFPFVATLMGMRLTGKHSDRVRGIEGEPLEKLIFKNVRELLIRSTEIIPIVIVMEDLHWADASSLLLLDSVYRLVPTQKIVFINVFRPGYWDGDEGTVETLKARVPNLPVLEIRVQPLDAHNSETLIDNILNIKGLHSSIKGQIVERAGGNPFFIEEMVRSLIDEGAVKAGDDGFEVTDKIHSVVIPPTINEVLMARIERLDEESRSVLKIASVIGPSFFYRILADVATRVEGLDDRLAYLKQIQLIRDRMRMEELEYAFRHALVQEAAYESIVLQQRKHLHLRVAEAIERVFREKLHEFYGMLAYHYGRDENLEKAEECLIKAGEEALKSAASNEALHYYQEALNTYRMVRGEAADPEKIAMLEKNIGFALFNRGYYAEAVEHFDKALSYFWGKFPKNAVSTAWKFLSSFITFLLALYFPSRWFKKSPTQHDTESVDLFYKKTKALVIINPKRFFIESFFFCATIVRFDLTKFKFGVEMFASASALFSFTGLSLGIGRRILDYAKPRLAADDAKQRIIYDLLDTQHLFLKGQWSEITKYDEDLVTKVLRIGETWDAAQHFYWHGLPSIFRGDFDEARRMGSKLTEIAEAYENDIYHLLKHLLNIYLFVESRHIEEATAELNQGIDLVRRKGWGLSVFNMYSLKAAVHLLMQETEEARNSLDQANQIRSEMKVVPIQLAAYYRSELEYYLCRLEGCLKNGRGEESSELRKNALKSGKMLIKTCRKAALYRTESYRLMGVYHWLTGDRKRAFTWWRKAISEGEGLGARPQLARTYAEMGQHTWLAKEESPEPDAIRAEAYLEEAKTMFRDLGLHRDLESLNSLMNRNSLDPFES